MVFDYPAPYKAQLNWDQLNRGDLIWPTDTFVDRHTIRLGGITFELVVLQPKSRGWVRLADSDSTSMPLIHPNFMGEEEDLRAAVESVRTGLPSSSRHSSARQLCRFKPSA